MHTDTSFPSTPANDSPQALPHVPKPRARWRWWAHLLIIASYPLFAALSAVFRYTDGAPKLPRSVAGLLLLCALQIGVFGAFWLLAWAFSRATKDELWLRWRGGWRPPLWGFWYAIALLFAEVFVLYFALAVLTILFAWFGSDSQRAAQFFAQNQPQTKELLNSISGTGVLYRFLVVTLLSFVVAGGCEEFWRSATMVGIMKVCPARWSPVLQQRITVVVAAITFGIGHSYQGWTGVIATGLIGVALGAITLRHQSVWPAVLAHGCFDAITFSVALASGRPH